MGVGKKIYNATLTTLRVPAAVVHGSFCIILFVILRGRAKYLGKTFNRACFTSVGHLGLIRLDLSRYRDFLSSQIQF